MDGIVEIAGAIVILIILVVLAVVAFGLIVSIGAVVGVIFLLVKIVKAIIADIEKGRQEEAQRRVMAAEEQKKLIDRMNEEAERQKREQLRLEDEQQQQRREQERLEQERIRQEQEEAARQRLEAESDKTAQSLPKWNDQLLVQRPSPEQINAVVEDTSRMQAHTGKYLHVIALVSWSGVTMEWKAHTGAACVPQVVGVRDNKEIMFTEWAYAGQHTAMLPAGRHVLTFQVRQGGESDHEHDLAFEIFVPTAPLVRTTDQFKKAVDATTKQFVHRAKTVAQARRKVNDTLVNEGTDPDEIAVEMSKLEVQLKDLHQEKD